MDKSLCNGIAHTRLSEHHILCLAATFISFHTVDDQIQHKKVLFDLVHMILCHFYGGFSLFSDFNDGLQTLQQSLFIYIIEYS